MPIQYGLYAAMVPCFVAAHVRLEPADGDRPGQRHLAHDRLPDLAARRAVHRRLRRTRAGAVPAGRTAAAGRSAWCASARWIDKVPHSVVVGFTAGVALLIINSQTAGADRHRPRRAARRSRRRCMRSRPRQAPSTGCAAGLGVFTLLVIVAWGPWNRRVPAMLVGVVAGIAASPGCSSPGGRRRWRCAMVPPLPSALPAFQRPGAVGIETMRALFSATLVMTLLGLTEASAIARSLALRSRREGRRQPGVHRPGPRQHRRQLLLRLSQQRVVQPLRGEHRQWRPHAAGSRVGGASGWWRSSRWSSRWPPISRCR